MIRTSNCRAPASELVLQRVSLESKIVYRGVACGLRKTEKIFTINNEQGIIKRGFQKKLKYFDLEKMLTYFDRKNIFD